MPGHASISASASARERQAEVAEGHGLTCFTKTMSGRASASRRAAGLARARSEVKRLGRPHRCSGTRKKRIRDALAAAGRPGVRVIAKNSESILGVAADQPPFRRRKRRRRRLAGARKGR
jgi:hypothetical protein